jgi:hypothetical protein
MFSFFVAPEEFAVVRQKGGNPEIAMDILPSDAPATHTTEPKTQVQ